MRGTELQELAKAPGVAWTPQGYRVTWDMAPFLAAGLGRECPPHPLAEDAAYLEALSNLPGLQAFKDLNLHKRLRPYQVEDALRLALMDWGFLANPMRTGKTPTAIASCVAYGAKKTVCVVPAIAVQGWAEDIAKFTGRSAVILRGRAADHFRIFCVNCLGTGRVEGQSCPQCRMKNGQSRGSLLIRREENPGRFDAILRHASFIVVNYEIVGQQINKRGDGRLYLADHLPGWAPTLAGLGIDSLLLDESHMLRGFPKRAAGSIREGTAISERIFALAEAVPRVICISGTPQFGRVEHWWQQLRIASKNVAACSGTNATPWDFHVRYCDGHKGAYGWVSSGTSELARTELAERIKLFSIMRSLESVYADLPRKTRRSIRVEKEAGLSPKEVADLKKLAYVSGSQRDKRITSKVKSLSTQTARVKLPTIIDAVKADITPDSKTMVVCYYPTVAEMYAKALEKALSKFTSVTGRKPAVFVAHGDGISIAARRDRAKEFREYDGPAVFVMTIDAFQVGVSLRGALTEHWVEVHHDPAACLQAEARPYEPDPVTGKLDERGLLINYYLVVDSIDEHRLDLLLPKIEALDAVVGSADAAAMTDAFATESFTDFAASLLQRLTAHLDKFTDQVTDSDLEPEVDMDLFDLE